MVIPVISLIILITPDIFAFNKTNPRAYSNLINLLLTINIVNFFLINEISKRKNYKRKQNNYQDRLNSNKTNTFNLERLIKVSAVLCMIQINTLYIYKIV